MPLVKVGARHQVTIPKEIVDKLRLKSGDYVEVTLEDSRVVIVPKAIVDREDAWFWSKEWQEKEREADEDIKAGRVKRFKNVEALIKDLNR
jgi:AbrB family looped-hinge helix DNA binding protein